MGNGRVLLELEDEPTVRLTYKPATAIEPSSPEWLIRKWLLLRALNLLAGRQGSGKTTFVSYLVALLTRGLGPLGDVGRDPIRVAWLSLEEPDDRVVARLMAAGAELENVIILGDVQDVGEDGRSFARRWQLPRDIAILGELIAKESVSLVVIDGLGYSISGDSHNYSVVGSALSALASLFHAIVGETVSEVSGSLGPARCRPGVLTPTSGRV
jgi:RecA-family ATPase